jgi:hypothetical protein
MYKKDLVNFAAIYTLEWKLLNKGIVGVVWIHPTDPNK